MDAYHVWTYIFKTFERLIAGERLFDTGEYLIFISHFTVITEGEGMGIILFCEIYLFLSLLALHKNIKMVCKCDFT